MGKQRSRYFVAIALLAAASGCCTRYSMSPKHLVGLRYADEDGEIVEHYHIQNYGWYLFNVLPIVCGETDRNAFSRIAFFSDQVRPDIMTGIFNDRVRETGSRPACVATHSMDLVTFAIPGISIPIVVPYVICYREVQMSGLLLKDGGEETPGKEGDGG